MTTRQDNMFTAAFQYEPINQAQNTAHKQRIVEIMHQMVNAPPAKLKSTLEAAYHPNARVNVTHPINGCEDLETVRVQLWQPLRRALPDVERRDAIVAGGLYQGAQWIGCVGHYVGTFTQDWLDIPATHGIVNVRFGEGHELRDGKIARSYVFIDFLDLMRQAGYWPLVPSLGREMGWLPPMTHDGVLLAPQDNAISQQSIERVLRMHAALGQYDGRPPTRDVLDKMEMVRHWHPKFMWYGPAGIGTTRGLQGFEDYHQIPFLVAFPDRGGSAVGHFIRIGDGRYAVTGGWSYLQATHTGHGFLGLPPTGRHVKMRVMDFYRCNDETICENWVPFDIPHLLLQMGIDVFGRMRSQFRHAAGVSDWLIGDKD